MEDIKIHHFERILQNNPKSRAFAPLSEAHRKNGQLEKALEIALRGVESNPDYHGGRVALARVLVDLNQLSEAKNHLEHVIENEADNILALRVLGKIFIQLKDFERAIKIYTSISFLRPEDQKSERILQGLKKNEPSIDSKALKTPEFTSKNSANLENKIAFIDALMDQSKYSKAESELNAALQIYKSHPDLKKRLQYLGGLSRPSNNIQKSSATTPYAKNMRKIKLLNLVLNNIEERLNNDPNFRF